MQNGFGFLAVKAGIDLVREVVVRSEKVVIEMERGAVVDLVGGSDAEPARRAIEVLSHRDKIERVFTGAAARAVGEDVVRRR